jgi:hypothetical protein
MTDTTTRDLEYLRRLTEAGRHAPLSAGPYLIAGGGWFGFASLIMGLLELAGNPARGNLPGAVFLAAALGFGLHLAYLIRRDRGQTETHSNAAINAAWTAAGFGIFAFWIAATIVAVRHQSEFFMNSIPLLVLAVYGIAWWVAAVVSQQAWMKSVVAATYLGLLVVAVAIGSRYVWLAYALALLGTALLPGLRLVRTAARERSAASVP